MLTVARLLNPGAKLLRPSLQTWREWTYDDYVAYFLSHDAMRARLRGERSVASHLNEGCFEEFCKPIRLQFLRLFGGTSPRVSIQLPAYNEEAELLATLVSYTLLDIEPGVAQVIVADNNSSDHTAAIVHNVGAEYAFCEEKGMGRARRAAYEKMASSAEYVWLTDSDARVVPPLRVHSDLSRKSTIVKTNIAFLDSHPSYAGVSTGGVYEGSHWSYAALHALAVGLRRLPRYHCWTGYNQFVRRAALDAIGGIHPDIPYRDREDHQRQYELARYAKQRGFHMGNANTDPRLVDPVYHSGRRRATLRQVLGGLFGIRRRRNDAPKDRYGFPVHPKDRIKAD